MRPLRYSINISLDGCVDHLSMPADAELHRYHADSLARADALIFGRVIYQMMESAWREPAETGVPQDWMEPWMMSFAQTIHAAKKYVASTTLEQVDWNAELIRGDLAQFIRELKQQPGKGLFVGGVKFPLALAELGLIDEVEFIVLPRIVGHGPSVLAGLSKHIDLKLVSTHELKSGAVALRYEVKN
jgi:dihydrofolate reductase